MEDLIYGTDYHTVFDPKSYLQYFNKIYKVNEEEKGLVLEFRLKSFHKFWSNVTQGSPRDSKGVRCLEFGGGPSIANLVSACPKVDRIVFAEYTAANREAVASWIAGSPEAHKWSTLIKYVVEDIEGGAVDEKVISDREEQLKQKIKSVVACDVTKNLIVDLESVDVGNPFDVVSTSGCLEVCSSSENAYKSNVAKLCEFLKPNGYLCMFGVLNETYCNIGDEKCYSFPLTQSLIEEAMNDAGITEIKFEVCDANFEPEVSNAQFMYFVFGRMDEINNKINH